MAQDSESRLKKIMDKLYYTPRPRLSTLSLHRGNDVIANDRALARALALRRPVEKTAPCRPWDRKDLFSRLTTFKAMTWFGKPKVISPLNCARRGWINAEMDIIVCEACGARLLFSTPPSWTLQQVEKAAAVFSLKLDNGHKLLCPWIDNACDESLASFPPSPPQVLVEGFKERSHAILRLTTLPVISSLTLDSMNNPQFDRFLSAPFHPSIILGNGIRLIDDCRSKDLHDTTEDGDCHGYYQALKIISLCGWEPRLLPYTIEFEDKSGQSAKTTTSLVSSEEIPCEATQNITHCLSNSHNDVGERKDSYTPLGEFQYDQSSTVLDCKFCGACVGLWFFKTIPRPLEFFKVVIDSSPQSELATGTADLAHDVEVPRVENCGRGDHNSIMEKPFGLHLTIAGGPPPTKQHFRPKISLPAVSRHIRAELSYNSYLRYHQDPSGKEAIACQEKGFNGHHDAGSQAVGSLKRKRSDIENSNSQLHLEGNHDDMGNGLAREVGLHLEGNHDDMGNGLEREVGSELNSIETPYNTPCTDVIVRDAVASQIVSVSKPIDTSESNDLVSRLDESNCGDTPENDNCDPSVPAFSSIIKINSSTCSKAGDKGLCFQTTDGTSVGKQDSIGSAKKVSVSITREEDVDHLLGNLKQPQAIDFDPIKQHRPFCPWISDEGKNLPGWKATLSALDDLEKDSSQQPEQTEAASDLLDEADDPIASVRKLFASPPFKRLKGSR
ncbi:hypothetical protein M5K25_025300 [Dendrobium thyrsiflorum]|uniref:C3HC-type domain-containing protein n=1 Tax=Dendrobium thyrsiflorum TaxID=117978 RepID=A0ABD0U428_DENTH